MASEISTTPQEVPVLAISSQTVSSEPEVSTGSTFSVQIDGTDLEFNYRNEGGVYLAWYVDDEEDDDPLAFPVADVVGALGGSAADDLVEVIPPTLAVTLSQVLYAYLTEGDTTTHVFSFSLGAGFDLSSVSPLLAQALTDEEVLVVGDLQICATTAALGQTDVETLNQAILAADPTLTGFPDRDLSAGLAFGYSLTLAGEERLFDLAVEEPAVAESEESAEAQTEEPADDEATEDESSSALTLVKEESTYTLWYELQKSFGAVEFSRLGLRYVSDESNTLWFLLDATLKSGSMEMSLQELGFGSGLTEFDPAFRLAGIGISYATDSLTLAGQLALVNPEDITEGLEGAAVVQTKAFSLSAIAAYQQENGHPSLFVYGVLDRPIGGPAFFFVEGLAAGLGYNRALTTPAIEDIPDYPLVSMACSPTTDAEELAAMVRDLQESITPSVGEQFYAFGVKFNTFKIVDSFALLIALVDGASWKLRLLGYSALTAPLPKEGETTDPLAYLELALDGTLDPGAGEMAIQGQLTDNSFIFSRDCRVTGGFAFYAWFSGDHEGDFVETIGGYHPDFVVPAHYPTVPRLALDWRISSSISVEGELYFALTPRMLMAGGYLKATWSEGGIEAWFKTRADFLVSWKPYSYSAALSIEVGVSATIKVDLGFTKVHRKLTVSVGADLKLWGPEFSGKAKIKCSFASFTISFGSTAKTVEALDWSEFRSSFLPTEGEDVFSIQPVKGVLGSVNGSTNAWVVSAKDLILQIDTLVPVSNATFGEAVELTSEGEEFGLAPMDVAAAVSTLNVSFLDAAGARYSGDLFTVTARYRNFPAAVWGTRFSPGLNESGIVEVLAGLTITPALTESIDEGEAIISTSDSVIGVDRTDLDEAFAWLDAPLPRASAAVPATDDIVDAYAGSGANIATAILDDLDSVDTDGFDTSLFRAALQVEQWQSASTTV
jgi:hypothetical protein